MPDDRLSERWMLYPVRAEQIKATGSDDIDHAEWVIRADGPLPSHPVKVVAVAEVERLRERLEHIVGIVRNSSPGLAQRDLDRCREVAENTLEGR